MLPSMNPFPPQGGSPTSTSLPEDRHRSSASLTDGRPKLSTMEVDDRRRSSSINHFFNDAMAVASRHSSNTSGSLSRSSFPGPLTPVSDSNGRLSFTRDWASHYPTPAHSASGSSRGENLIDSNRPGPSRAVTRASADLSFIMNSTSPVVPSSDVTSPGQANISSHLHHHIPDYSSTVPVSPEQISPKSSVPNYPWPPAPSTAPQAALPSFSEYSQHHNEHHHHHHHQRHHRLPRLPRHPDQHQPEPEFQSRHQPESQFQSRHQPQHQYQPQQQQQPQHYSKSRQEHYAPVETAARPRQRPSSSASSMTRSPAGPTRTPKSTSRNARAQPYPASPSPHEELAPRPRPKPAPAKQVCRNEAGEEWQGYVCITPGCQESSKVPYRKVISQYLGRNKQATLRIPVGVIPLLCRKCYQQRSYRSKKTGDFWSIQSDLLAATFDNAESFQGERNWNIILAKSMQTAVDAYPNNAGPSRCGSTRKSSTKVYSGEIIRWTRQNILPLLGPNQSTDDCRHILDVMVRGCQAYSFPELPDLEFLPMGQWGARLA